MSMSRKWIVILGALVMCTHVAAASGQHFAEPWRAAVSISGVNLGHNERIVTMMMPPTDKGERERTAIFDLESWDRAADQKEREQYEKRLSVFRYIANIDIYLSSGGPDPAT